MHKKLFLANIMNYLGYYLCFAFGGFILGLMVIWFRTRDQQKTLNKISIILQERDNAIQDLRSNLVEQQLLTQKILQESVQNSVNDIRSQLSAILNLNVENITRNLDKLTDKTEQRLQAINVLVENRLNDGFAKTSHIFTDVVTRLALIDEAQKKITDLSNNVVDLQGILNDKRSRGAFGEVQLEILIRNLIPETNFALQHPLSNNTRVDCMLFLPAPTGNISIDAKFPLENYKKLIASNQTEIETKNFEKQFRADIRKHLHDIAEKYILPPETADGAMMFIPAEAVFAEIHAHYHDLVELSHKLKVWIVSPTTMMAVLTTAKAVLKDVATRKQIHTIQEHLVKLGQDFIRFQARMNDLTKHVELAYKDVDQVSTSAKKITAHFKKIEKVELLDS